VFGSVPYLLVLNVPNEVAFDEAQYVVGLVITAETFPHSERRLGRETGERGSS
jgi:hypothetical protein